MLHRCVPRFAALALLALLLIGCGAPTASGALSPSPAAAHTPTALPNQTPAQPAPGDSGSPVITLADDGGTITMHAGERFLLDLGALGGGFEQYDWTAVPADPSVLSRVPNILTIRGSQGLYEAHKPGQTELTATGEADCRRTSPPCPAPSRSFSVTVVVVD
jgi:hypothetical protein